MFKKFAVLLALLVFVSTGCSARQSAQLDPPSKGETIAVMKTSMGDIKIKYFAKDAPKTVENFVKLSQKGYYNNLTFHRVINDFMIQGGDPTGTGRGGESIWGKPFENEVSDNVHHFRGALSMANAGPDTNGSQFFIVQNPTVTDSVKSQMEQAGVSKEVIDQYARVGGMPQLDYGYSVFGQVFEGMDVVDKIAAVTTGAADKPLEDVKIISVEITKFK